MNTTSLSGYIIMAFQSIVSCCGKFSGSLGREVGVLIILFHVLANMRISGGGGFGGCACGVDGSIRPLYFCAACYFGGMWRLWFRSSLVLCTGRTCPFEGELVRDTVLGVVCNTHP